MNRAAAHLPARWICWISACRDRPWIFAVLFMAVSPGGSGNSLACSRSQYGAQRNRTDQQRRPESFGKMNLSFFYPAINRPRVHTRDACRLFGPNHRHFLPAGGAGKLYRTAPGTNDERLFGLHGNLGASPATPGPHVRFLPPVPPVPNSPARVLLPSAVVE